MGMLMLGRRKGERVVVTFEGSRVELLVTAIRQGVVRLGFAAPQEVQINRGEVQDEIDRGEARGRVRA